MKNLSPSLKALLAILNDGAFHSGNALGEAVQISRNAVWKHINQLIKFDIDIETIQSKGYRLRQPCLLLNAEKIKSHIHYVGSLPKIKLHLLGSIPSTNEYLRTQLPSRQMDFCLAEHQSSGKGRLGHHWYSPFGANIYLSCRWVIDKDVSKLSGLSLVMSLAVIAALEECGITDLTAKWPNDILWEGKKISGILIEMDAESHGSTQVTIGIGLNVNMPLSAKEHINRSWISLDQLLGFHQDRNPVAGKLINHVLRYLDIFSEQGFAYFLAEWKRYDLLYHKHIKFMVRKSVSSGLMQGVNEQGQLLLQDKSGEIATYSAGEASLIKQ